MTPAAESCEKVDIRPILEELPRRRRVPVSTYRLQLHKGFGFKEMQAILPYLSELGVTDCYTSPILKAQPGSMHGYDICDHRALNPELGSVADYEAFVADLKARQMGHILDFVPNHMGIDPEANPWWRDVLENGPLSRYARFFDIYWNPIKPELKGKVLLPILGDQYGIVLERGELTLVYDKGRFAIRYFSQSFPLDPREYPQVLSSGLEGLKSDLKGDPALAEFLSVIMAFSNLPARGDSESEAVATRRREKGIAQERLSRLELSSERIHTHIEEAVKTFNGRSGEPSSYDLLHRLLESQAYRLSYWKAALHEINYRRFFDVNQLAALRVENEDVFSATHAFVMGLAARGHIQGLRIDHPDGLFDPAGYFEALQDLFLRQWVKEALPPAPQEEKREEGEPPAWLEELRSWRVMERKKDPRGLAARPLYLAAEKILSSDEALDAHWAIDGTSGYDFLNDVNELFVDSRHAVQMEELYARFTGQYVPYSRVVYESKKLIMSTSLASELNFLAHALNRISEQDRRSRDFTLDSLRDALKEVVACFPVYRTYINFSRGGAADRKTIDCAVAEAKRLNPATESSIFDFIRTILTPENAEKVSAKEFQQQLWFAMKFQQFTAPVQAKGVEDTAFYRHHVLVSLNEVGGDPESFGRAPARFHEQNQARRREWPCSMLATATHDTKRGEDTRARLNALSEMPEDWGRRVFAWSELNAKHRMRLGKEWAPDRNDEYLFYQSLLGAWAGEESLSSRKELHERLRRYMIKAIKESKLHTSWISPNEAYEEGVIRFIDAVMSEEGEDSFFAAFVPVAKRVAPIGMLNSLSQLALKLASPGVPDFYQGSELWDLSLVDPDNRRPVDYAKRREMLRQLDEPNVPQWLKSWEDGRIKLFLTARGLRLRRQYPELLLDGDYVPLAVEGPEAEHVVAFARSYQDQTLLAVAPRLVRSLAVSEEGLPLGERTWETTSVKLPSGFKTRYRNIFTDEEVFASGEPGLFVRDLLAQCPVGLFISCAA